jgi:prevent-host-death family protein
MGMKSLSQIPAGQFKARCLAILDDVQRQRRGVVITKRGKPVARLVPVEDPDGGDALRGSVLYEGDLISPLSERWDES